MVNSSKRSMPIVMSPTRTTEAGLFRIIKSMLPLMALAGLSLAVSGCGSKDDHHEDHDDEHHHDDHHLEHFVPAHKPADYGALVDQLEKRIAGQSPAAGSGEGTKNPAQLTTERQELIDIIGWIPELAADSELRKKDFEAAVAAGTRLSIALGFVKQTDGSSPVDASKIPELLDELKALVSKSQTSTEPM